MTDVRIINAEALVVGADEVLIVKVPETADQWLMDAFIDALGKTGLGDQYLVVAGEVEFAKVKR